MANIFKLLMFTILAAALSGCMIVSETAIFQASPTVDMPDISGAFTDPKHGTFILSRNGSSGNGYTLTSPDKQTMALVFEPLPTKGRYVVQVANPAGPQVLLALCAIAEQSVDIYGIKPPEISALAKKRGVTINEKGVITNNPGAKKLLQFFNESFDPKYSEKITSIRPGHSKKTSGK